MQTNNIHEILSNSGQQITETSTSQFDSELSLFTPPLQTSSLGGTSLNSNISSLHLNSSPINNPAVYGEEELAHPQYNLPTYSELCKLGIQGVGPFTDNQISIINSLLRRNPSSSSPKSTDFQPVLTPRLLMSIRTKKRRRNRSPKNQMKPETTVAAIWEEVKKLQEAQAVPTLSDMNHKTSTTSSDTPTFEEDPLQGMEIGEWEGDAQVQNFCTMEETRESYFCHDSSAEDRFTLSDEWILGMLEGTTKPQPSD